uniref:Uncharacterized protein n=1 Tax=Anopheles christyi TaxID=43041 RepID=A0A182KIF8_9DIPT
MSPSKKRPPRSGVTPPLKYTRSRSVVVRVVVVCFRTEQPLRGPLSVAAACDCFSSRALASFPGQWWRPVGRLRLRHGSQSTDGWSARACGIRAVCCSTGWAVHRRDSWRSCPSIRGSRRTPTLAAPPVSPS